LAADPAALLDRLTDEHGKRHQRFQANYLEKTEKLLACLLPNVEASTLERLSEAGFGFAKEMLQSIERDRERCLAELAALEQQSSVFDDGGSAGVADELKKLEGHFDALQPFLKTCFNHPRFDELLIEGYGTKEYSKKVWHLSYYLDRRAAKEIEKLCDGRKFSAIRREAIQALEASNVLKDRIRSLKERKKALASMASQRRKLQERLDSHQQIWLASARRRLHALLESDPEGSLEKSRALCPEEAYHWRLAKELCKEHWNLETRFLKPAREARQQGLMATCVKILNEYEPLVEAMKRFDQPTAPGEAIDWKSFIFNNRPV
jgi:hypothetical protein